MPTPPNPALTPSPPATPRKMPRLRLVGRTIKLLATLFGVAFLCAYARTYTRYGEPRTATRASLSRPSADSFFSPNRVPRHRRPILRPVRHVRRRPQRTGLYRLATFRRLRRLFSQLLVVRT